tara:strand:- start:7780 stop:8145 length:366 start_codon:yes stop_codon:yes gene_type:complete
MSLDIRQRRSANALLSELRNKLDSWPNAALLAEDLEELLRESPPRKGVALVWHDLMERQVTMWTVPLTVEERHLVRIAHDAQELPNDDPTIVELQDILLERGRKVKTLLEGQWLLAKVTTT